MEDEHDDVLEKKFEKLTYVEIEKILTELGTSFKEPIKSIPKQHIYATIEFDYPIENIRDLMKKLRNRRA